MIALEDAKVKDLTASAKGTRAKPGKLVQEQADANRWILNVAPYQTRRMLEYKAARRGGTVIAVDLDDSDTATPCFACGSVSDGPRKSRANFVCGDCGHEENADLNAARNILFRAIPGRAMAPREASRDSGFGSQGAPKAIESPSGPATMRALLVATVNPTFVANENATVLACCFERLDPLLSHSMKYVVP